MKSNLQIAIDGPAGAGKSNISKLLAERLGILYLYTGVMYRAITYVCLKEEIDIKNEEAVVTRLKNLTIELKPVFSNGRPWVRVFVKGEKENVTHDLFESEVEKKTPVIAAYKRVREEMVKRQQEIAKGQSVVAEGRDVGLRVFPQAQLKIYLTATVEERAKRRFMMLKKENQKLTYDKVLKDTIERDRVDMIRSVDPLRKLSDAWELDTTNLSIDEVVSKIEEKLKSRKLI